MPTANRAMRLFTSQVDTSPDLQDMIKQISDNTTDQIRAVLEFTRSDILAFLRSYTNVYRPPRYERKFRLDATSRRVQVGKGDTQDWRPAHPGGWADVEDDLRQKYFTELNWVGGAWQLSVGNKSEHAIYVEMKDGFFVVQGVMEPKGPVAQSIRRAIKALGLKDWVVAGDAGATTPQLNISPKSGKPVPTPDLGPWR